MGKNLFFRQKKMKTFVLSEVDKVKNGILILDEDSFDIVEVYIENGLEDYEREIVIEEELERKIPNYDPTEYIEKEIHVSNDGTMERNVIILLKRDKINKIIEELYGGNIRVSGVVPRFLVEYLKKENENCEMDLYMGNTKMINTVYNNRDIISIKEKYINKKEIIESETDREILVKEIEDMIKEVSNDGISVDKIRYKDDIFAEILQKIDFAGKIEKIPEGDTYLGEVENLDFIPPEQKDLITKKKIKNICMVSTACAVVFEITLYMVFGYIEDRYIQKNGTLDEKISNISAMIQEKRDQAENIEGYGDKIELLSSVIEKNKIKFGDILRKIEKNNGNNVIFDWVEYKDKGVLQIRGKSENDRDIYTFEENIAKNADFTKINHDYIRKKDDIYEFQLDIGIDMERNVR